MKPLILTLSNGFILMSLIFVINTFIFFSPKQYLILKVEATLHNNDYYFYPENYKQIKLPKVNGPESFAFDCKGKGPYTGVSDGRILKWEGPKFGWKEFAITSPNRPRDQCDGSINPETDPICGRPLGLKFNLRSCHLYIADAYFGLLVVGPNGGVARPISNSAEGVPFVFTNGLDIDPKTGVIYFTDSSARYQIRNVSSIIKTGDRTGRLLQYDPCSNQTTTLLNNLAFANGVAISHDSTFLVFAETNTRDITKLWLRGPKAHKSELFAKLARPPDNIKRTKANRFWVGLNTQRSVPNESLPITSLPRVLVVPPWVVDPVGLELNEEGKLVGAVDGGGESELESVSEVLEHSGSLWFGSAMKDYVGVIHKNSYYFML